MPTILKEKLERLLLPRKPRLNRGKEQKPFNKGQNQCAQKKHEWETNRGENLLFN